MSFFQVLDCKGAMLTLVNAVETVLNMIRWAIPIVLIILGSVDMFKGMTSGDDKEAEKAKKTFIRRLIYAVVAFLIPTLVTLTFNVVSSVIVEKDENQNEKTDTAIQDANNHSNNFFECWYTIVK